MSFITNTLKLDRFEPDRIVTSNLVRPLTLAILRGLACLYTLIVIISSWVTAESASDYLKFFTNLTYIGLVVYLVCSTIWSINYLRQPLTNRAAWLKSGSPWWGYMHWLLYSTVVTYHFIVPIVYWTMLNTQPVMNALGHWQNYSVHAIDGVFALFELVFNRHFLQPRHSFVVAAVMILYMLLTFVVKKTKGEWVYPFLDWDQGPICAAYYLGMAVILFVIFFLLLVVHRFRNRWLARRCAVVNEGLELEAEGRMDHGGGRVQPEENGQGGYHANQSDFTLEEGGIRNSKNEAQTY
ncbi:hypothetical protein BG015_002497 [Linnemannia schmuckeri]|uniref:FAR-17a/AIG1-like protein n=1 Tax=Linnemannia schmuckeri TaxID=64567 RepID=A0A9P5VF56_9FUNG|nr:hypothetical protein BG015_002497 [Linnemannia schmuckeri]